jgi:hypothetical protein
MGRLAMVFWGLMAAWWVTLTATTGVCLMHHRRHINKDAAAASIDVGSTILLAFMSGVTALWSILLMLDNRGGPSTGSDADAKMLSFQIGTTIVISFALLFSGALFMGLNHDGSSPFQQQPYIGAACAAIYKMTVVTVAVVSVLLALLFVFSWGMDKWWAKD